MEPNQPIRNYPMCSIPYIDLKVYPKRFEENEKNKIEFKWQEGDSWYDGCASLALFKWTKNFINDSPDQEKYKSLKKNMFSYGSGMVVCFAAKDHHYLLIEQMVTLFGKHFLDMGNSSGDVPLIYAVHDAKKNTVFPTVKMLFSLGAHPNMASRFNVTPLKQLVEKTNHYMLMNLFCLHGAIASPELTDEEKAKLHTAKWLFFEELNVHLLFKGVFDSNSSLHVLLPEIAREITLKRIDLFKY